MYQVVTVKVGTLNNCTRCTRSCREREVDIINRTHLIPYNTKQKQVDFLYRLRIPTMHHETWTIPASLKITRRLTTAAKMSEFAGSFSINRLSLRIYWNNVNDGKIRAVNQTGVFSQWTMRPDRKYSLVRKSARKTTRWNGGMFYEIDSCKASCFVIKISVVLICVRDACFDMFLYWCNVSVCLLLMEWIFIIFAFSESLKGSEKVVFVMKLSVYFVVCQLCILRELLIN